MQAWLPVQTFKGVGPKLLPRLHALGIFNARDVLLHLPMRYQDRTQLQLLASVTPGETVLIQGKILKTKLIPVGKKRLICTIADDTGVLELVFFHVFPHQQKQLCEGALVRCFGEVHWQGKGYGMTHPEYTVFSEGNAPPFASTLTPIYSSTDGVSQNLLRQLVDQALVWLSQQTYPELLSDEVRAHHGFPTLLEALRTVHHPKPMDLESIEQRQHPAFRYLAVTELLAHQLSLGHARGKIQSEPATAFPASDIKTTFLESLPFPLTHAQQRAVAEIETDLAKPVAMQRLLLGDVGSGKTVVAAMAMLQVVAHGAQAALMVPTELLTDQHVRNFERWCAPLGIAVVVLKSSLPAPARTAALEKIASGVAQIIIGTHALFQESVAFHQLGLIIIDEQHRFGVHQRALLKGKGVAHQLFMTATPIPRTLAIFMNADLDISVLDEKPPGRQDIKTVLIEQARRAELTARVQAHCEQGKQAYWVCPLIEASEDWPLKAAEELAIELRKTCQVRVGLLHGRLKNTDKENIMRAFLNHEIDLLVATTVVEVGVDVPNASLMIIENAERMGLAQLHQLRGRVGRGSEASFCVLMYQQPLSPEGRERLALVRENQDGFKLAEADLRMRGAGEMLGLRQSGLAHLRVADFEKDQSVWPIVLALKQKIPRKIAYLSNPLIHFWIESSEGAAPSL